jgi:hypothetical protein
MEKYVCRRIPEMDMEGSADEENQATTAERDFFDSGRVVKAPPRRTAKGNSPSKKNNKG